jgi:hypothetical protein
MISLLSLSVFSKLPSPAEKDFLKTLNEVRSSYSTKDMSFQIAKLEKASEEGQIDIAEFGLGRGIFKYWLEVTTKVSKKLRSQKCKNLKASFSHKTVSSTHLNSDQYLKYSSKLNEKLSALTERDAQEVFNILRGYDKELVYSEYGMGCESRAYAMNLIMDEMCINSAKVFIESEKIQLKDHNWSWIYHVAPIVLVKKGNEEIPYIMDPSLFKNAVPLQTWIEKLREQHYYNEYSLTFTDKYILLPKDKDLKLTSYRKADKEEADKRLFIRSLLRIVRPFKSPLKNE